MRRVASALVLAIVARAGAHRLDEYLQLTAISVEKHHVRALMILTPGVAVAKRVIALIDANGDGILSEAERRGYAARVLRDVSIVVDGVRLVPRLVAARFPKVAEMRRGTGEIDLDLDAPVAGGTGNHRLVFENRHQRSIAAYLVECFVPSDPGLRVVSQSRSAEQARYEMRYAQAAVVGRHDR